jgi:steroid delta-isomerase-like uncharacterized protein
LPISGAVACGPQLSGSVRRIEAKRRKMPRSAANKALIQQYVEAWNTGHLALMDELLAPDVACRFYGFAEVRGLEAFKQLTPPWTTVFPDSWFTIETIIAEDDLVAVHYSWRGTHQGEYLAIAATGKQVTETGTRFYRILGGKIVEM